MTSDIGLRLAIDGSAQKMKGGHQELPWSKVRGLASGNDKPAGTAHAARAWNSFCAASGSNTAARQVARRPSTPTHRDGAHE